MSSFGDRRVAIVNEAQLDPKRTAILRKKWIEPSYDDGERAAFKALPGAMPQTLQALA